MSSQTHCSICNNHLRNHGIWCTICGYIHLKCSGLSTEKDWFSNFVCPRCHQPDNTGRTEPLNHVPSPQPDTQASSSNEPTPDPPVNEFWRKIDSELTIKIKNFYSEVVHWKPCFQTVTKNKTGHKFVETLDCLLRPIAENTENAHVAFYAAMLLPHLILARTNSEPEVSRNKVMARRLTMWLNGEIEPLFNEAEALQKRLRKSTSKRKKDEFKEFDAHMTAGKISNAMRSINDSEKGGVLSLDETINGKTVLDILKEKHPHPIISMTIITYRRHRTSHRITQSSSTEFKPELFEGLQ